MNGTCEEKLMKKNITFRRGRRKNIHCVLYSCFKLNYLPELYWKNLRQAALCQTISCQRESYFMTYWPLLPFGIYINLKVFITLYTDCISHLISDGYNDKMDII